MKTQQQTQKIFNVLVIGLKYASIENLSYATRYLGNNSTDFTIDTPSKHFLKFVRKELTEEDISENFLNQVYAEAFHTSPIDKNCNHISIITLA